MPGAAVRPQFELDVASSADAVVARLRDRLESPGSVLEGTVLKRHCQITVRKAERHFWSPWLSFEVNDAPRGAHISGMFTPHPNVWTGWAALYAIVLFMAVGGLMMGLSQWVLDEYPWGLWLVPAGVLCGGGLWAAALVGQRLGATQMDEIRTFVTRAVGPPLPDESPARAAHMDDALVLTPGTEAS